MLFSCCPGRTALPLYWWQPLASALLQQQGHVVLAEKSSDMPLTSPWDLLPWISLFWVEELPVSTIAAWLLALTLKIFACINISNCMSSGLYEFFLRYMLFLPLLFPMEHKPNKDLLEFHEIHVSVFISIIIPSLRLELVN